jgi:hypothetical protein
VRYGWPSEMRMTRKQAEFIRKLRTEDGYTWRAVASSCAEEFMRSIRCRCGALKPRCAGTCKDCA